MSADSVFTDFHRAMKPGSAVLAELNQRVGSEKPSRKVVMKFPYEFKDEHGNIHPAGTLVEITIWTRVNKNGKKWFPGGVTRMGKYWWTKFIGTVLENPWIKRYLVSDNGK